MEINLTAKQKTNFMKGLPIQISQKQMMGGSLTAKHQMRINLNDNGKKKVQKAMRQQKGFRLQPTEHEGGSLLGKLGKVAKKVASNKQVQNFVIDQGMNALDNYMSGQGIMKSLKKVGKKVAKVATNPNVLSAVDAIGRQAGDIYALEVGGVNVNPYELGYTLGHDVIAPALMKDGKGVGKVLKKVGKTALKGAVKVASNKKVQEYAIKKGINALDNYLNSSTGEGFRGSGFKGSGFQGSGFQGSGFKGSGFQGSGRPQKGSQEAKDKMARIRAMKRGGSFRDY
jgi:hypothetical protein